MENHPTPADAQTEIAAHSEEERAEIEAYKAKLKAYLASGKPIPISEEAFAEHVDPDGSVTAALFDRAIETGVRYQNGWVEELPQEEEAAAAAYEPGTNPEDARFIKGCNTWITTDDAPVAPLEKIDEWIFDSDYRDTTFANEQWKVEMSHTKVGDHILTSLHATPIDPNCLYFTISADFYDDQFEYFTVQPNLQMMLPMYPEQFFDLAVVAIEAYQVTKQFKRIATE